MEEFPPVSIVISTHNRASILEKCLDSVFKLEYPKYEVIVINDGSNDKTTEVLRKYKNIKVISFKEPVGPVSAKNIGIKKARYNYIGLLDDDIILSKLWLKRLIGFETKLTASAQPFNFDICQIMNVDKPSDIVAAYFGEQFKVSSAI